MVTDATGKEPGAPRPRWELPEILDVKINRVPYEAPKLRYFESHLAKYTEAIEFLVKTDGPFPLRALPPVLYVGDVPVTENEATGENVYRFLAFEFDEMEEGASISLGWPDSPRRLETKYRFEFPSTIEQQ
jgi:hypothetical protein